MSDGRSPFFRYFKNGRIDRFFECVVGGKDHVLIEAGLMALAHNLAQMAKNQYQLYYKMASIFNEYLDYIRLKYMRHFVV